MHSATASKVKGKKYYKKIYILHYTHTLTHTYRDTDRNLSVSVYDYDYTTTKMKMKMKTKQSKHIRNFSQIVMFVRTSF